MANRDHMWRFTAAPDSGQVNLRVDATQIETTCGVKLTESRCGHLCLDAPIIVVKTTQNPCQARYRVIDGAHRLCVLVATMLAGAGTNTDRSGRQGAPRQCRLRRPNSARLCPQRSGCHGGQV